MSSKRFKFVSPGVFTREIDQSQVPQLADGIGPAVVGLATKGPAFQPVEVSSYKEFVETFGPTFAEGGYYDTWRNPHYAAPYYAAYAAKAYLRNGAPLTFVRLLGDRNTRSNSVASTSYAGWRISDEGATSKTNTNGGAYGLFIFPSSSVTEVADLQDLADDVTGSLGAIWYLNEGTIGLKGAPRGLSAISASSAGTLVTCGAGSGVAGPAGEWTVTIKNSSGVVQETTSFNFDKDNPRYIRKVFNTDATKLNSTIHDTTKTYFLGETFASHLDSVINSTSASAGDLEACILAIESGSFNGDDFRTGFKYSSTGWIFSQDTGEANDFTPDGMQKLFKIHCLNGGEYDQSSIKISIDNINYSQNPDANRYGTFDVVVRDIQDFDHKKIELERFSNVNLNPRSPRYIAKMIGDISYEWDYSDRRYRELGKFPNNSKYIRVEMNEDVEKAAVNAEFLPFGFLGPRRYKTIVFMSGAHGPVVRGGTVSASAADEVNYWVKGGSDIPETRYGNVSSQDTKFLWVGKDCGFTGSVSFPAIRNRADSSDANLRKPTDAYFGFDTRKTQTSAVPVFDLDVVDLLRLQPPNVSTNLDTSLQNYFSLDELGSGSLGSETALATWLSGSRALRDSTSGSFTRVSSSYKEVLDKGYNKFTMPLFGGFDGLNIEERNPFRNNQWTAASTELTSYSLNSVRRSLDALSDPDVVDFNLLAVPGITNQTLTDKMINVCEQRGDAMAIIDLEGGYVPSTDTSSAETSRKGTVTATVDTVKARRYNTSYAAAYYPWILIREELNGSPVWVPPSVAALGTMAYTEAATELWFAPAGFNRGGLSQGTSGLTVLNVRDKLTSDDRDELYRVNVNPIASFPAEGIVIFGQKTLQATPSALDRINVRRLLIFLKKRISRIANNVLFDQNVKETWDRFKGIVEPFLDSVKNRLGLAEYKLVLDETTTTPDLIDRNILYAKVYLKPARAIEFIALDFFITNTGASFEDL